MAEHVHKWKIDLVAKGAQLVFVGGCAVDGCDEELSKREVNRRLNATDRLRAGIDELKDACKDDPQEMGGPFVWHLYLQSNK